MNLTLKELNEIYYCLSKVLNSDEPSLADKEAITKLKTKIWDEIDMIEYNPQSNDNADIDAKGYLSNNEYQQWWEQNKERILAEDKLNHEMQFKSSYAKHGDY